jgi:tetratricopeptide (TPR) repeat protein
MRKLFVILLLMVCRFVVAQSRLDYFMTEAAKSSMQGQWTKAADLYSHCLEIDSCSPEALFQLGRLQLYLRRDSIGLEYIYKAVELDPKNSYYMEPLAAILLRQGCEEEALPLLERISELETKRSDVLSHLANLYSKADRLEEAIQTYDRLELLEGKLAQLSMQKFSLYMQLGDSVRAFAELQSLCHEYPAEMSYRVEMGYCYQQIGDYDTAMEIYNQVKSIEPTNVDLQMAMLDLYIMQGMDSLYEATRDSILYSPDTDTGKRIVLIQQMIQRMSPDSVDTERIIERFEKVVALDSADVEMLTMYASFLNYRERPEVEIQRLMARVLTVEPDNEMATQWLLQYYAGNRDYSSLEEICRRGVNYHPQELLYSYFLGMMLIERSEYVEALGVLNRGLRQRSEDTRLALLSEVFTLKGDVYYKMDRHEEAFLQYDSALVYNRDNVLCLNNYAYFLSLKNQDMDKAEEMSYRSIKAEPDNKTYLDTYAWILFMQEKYEEAQQYMDKVVPRESTEKFLLTNEYTSSVILEHAGDIAWMNGEQERAIYLWRLALKRGDKDVSSVLKKKSKKGKYYKAK